MGGTGDANFTATGANAVTDGTMTDHLAKVFDTLVSLQLGCDAGERWHTAGRGARGEQDASERCCESTVASGGSASSGCCGGAGSGPTHDTEKGVDSGRGVASFDLDAAWFDQAASLLHDLMANVARASDADSGSGDHASSCVPQSIAPPRFLHWVAAALDSHDERVASLAAASLCAAVAAHPSVAPVVAASDARVTLIASKVLAKKTDAGDGVLVALLAGLAKACRSSTAAAQWVLQVGGIATAAFTAMESSSHYVSEAGAELAAELLLMRNGGEAPLVVRACLRDTVRTALRNSRRLDAVVALACAMREVGIPKLRSVGVLTLLLEAISLKEVPGETRLLAARAVTAAASLEMDAMFATWVDSAYRSLMNSHADIDIVIAMALSDAVAIEVGGEDRGLATGLARLLVGGAVAIVARCAPPPEVVEAAAPSPLARVAATVPAPRTTHRVLSAACAALRRWSARDLSGMEAVHELLVATLPRALQGAIASIEVDRPSHAEALLYLVCSLSRDLKDLGVVLLDALRQCRVLLSYLLRDREHRSWRRATEAVIALLDRCANKESRPDVREVLCDVLDRAVELCPLPEQRLRLACAQMACTAPSSCDRAVAIVASPLQCLVDKDGVDNTLLVVTALEGLCQCVRACGASCIVDSGLYETDVAIHRPCADIVDWPLSHCHPIARASVSLIGVVLRDHAWREAMLQAVTAVHACERLSEAPDPATRVLGVSLAELCLDATKHAEHAGSADTHDMHRGLCWKLANAEEQPEQVRAAAEKVLSRRGWSTPGLLKLLRHAESRGREFRQAQRIKRTTNLDDHVRRSKALQSCCC